MSCTVDTRSIRGGVADAQAAFREHCSVEIRYVGHARVGVTVRPLSRQY
jgi:hypothetical protein